MTRKTRTCTDCDETMDSVAYWTHSCSVPLPKATRNARPYTDDLPEPNRDAVVWA